jgi:hypothetical protein
MRLMYSIGLQVEGSDHGRAHDARGVLVPDDVRGDGAAGVPRGEPQPQAPAVPRHGRRLLHLPHTGCRPQGHGRLHLARARAGVATGRWKARATRQSIWKRPPHLLRLGKCVCAYYLLTRMNCFEWPASVVVVGFVW